MAGARIVPKTQRVNRPEAVVYLVRFKLAVCREFGERVRLVSRGLTSAATEREVGFGLIGPDLGWGQL